MHVLTMDEANEVNGGIAPVVVVGILTLAGVAITEIMTEVGKSRHDDCTTTTTTNGNTTTTSTTCN